MKLRLVLLSGPVVTKEAAMMSSCSSVTSDPGSPYIRDEVTQSVSGLVGQMFGPPCPVPGAGPAYTCRTD